MSNIADQLLPPFQQLPPYRPGSQEETDLLISLNGDFANVREPAQRVNAVANVRFAPNAAAFAPAGKHSFLSERVHGGQDVATDISFLVRGLPGVGCTALDATLGMSTGINTPLGYNSYLHKTEQEEHAQTVGYDAGARIKQIERARCATQMVGGALFFGIRALTLASYVKGVDTSSATAPTLLGRVTCITSSIGSALWGFAYTLIAAVSSLGIYEGYKFRKELNAAFESPAATAAFIRKWSGTDEEELGKAVAGHSEEELRQEAMQCTVQLLKNEGREGTQQELEAEALRIIQEDAERVRANTQAHLVQVGEEWKIEKLKAMRDLQVASLTSKACADKLFGRRTYLDPQDLLTEMKTALDKNFWINLGYLVTCVIGVLATIGVFVLTAGVGPMIVAGAFLLVALMMTALDGYSLYDVIRSQEAQGTFDKHMLTMSTGISFLSFVGSIVLISVLSLGIVPLVAAIAIFLFWMGVNLKVWSALPPAGRLPLHAAAAVI